MPNSTSSRALLPAPSRASLHRPGAPFRICTCHTHCSLTRCSHTRCSLTRCSLTRCSLTHCQKEHTCHPIV
ncbi:MAG: hypothetical protein DCC57_14780 [Chloroflexi bacterium]|nr:MAG: hypothetical protein DCC57_14780 [Chloroflexota bacterium]